MVSLFFFNLEPVPTKYTSTNFDNFFQTQPFLEWETQTSMKSGNFMLVRMWLGCGHTPQFSQVITYKNK